MFYDKGLPGQPGPQEKIEAVNLRPEHFWKKQWFVRARKSLVVVICLAGLSFAGFLGLRQVAQNLSEFDVEVVDTSSIIESPPINTAEEIIGSTKTSPPVAKPGEEPKQRLTVVSGGSHQSGGGVDTSRVEEPSTPSGPTTPGEPTQPVSPPSDEDDGQPADILEVEIQYSDTTDRSNPRSVHNASLEGTRSIFLSVVNVSPDVIKRVEWFIDGNYHRYDGGTLRNNDLYAPYDMEPGRGSDSGSLDLVDRFGVGSHVILARLITETSDGTDVGAAVAWADEEAVVTVLQPSSPSPAPEPEPQPDPQPEPDPTPQPPSSGGGDTSLAPPSGWESYQTRNIGSGGSISLDDNQDYRLVFNQVANRRLNIKGGRNVVIIGGEVNISIAHGDINNDNDRMGMRLTDQTGVVHIEGVWFHGEYINEGIQIDAPDADVQLANIRIDNLKGAQQRPPYSHADIVQPWGGVKSLKIDGLTGSSRYQGLLFKADFDGPLGHIDVRNTNIEMIEGPSADSNFPNNGGRYGIAVANGSDSYTTINWDPGSVWLDTNSQYQGDWYENMIEFGSNDEPNVSDTGSDSLGQFWNMSSWKSQQTGRVYFGDPPTGDYVPSGSVGMGYTR